MWKDDEEIEENLRSNREAIGEELADTLYWTLLLRRDLKVDLATAFMRKMERNEEKYPVGKSKRCHTKYTRLSLTRLHASISKQFIEDTTLNQIAEKLRNSSFDHFRYKQALVTRGCVASVGVASTTRPRLHRLWKWRAAIMYKIPGLNRVRMQNFKIEGYVA